MKNINFDEILAHHFRDVVTKNIEEMGYFSNIYSISFWGWDEEGTSLVGWVEVDRFEGKVDVSMDNGHIYYYGCAGIYWYSNQAKIDHPEIDFG